jgi:two-component system chemotaxis response regulator CheB
MSKTKPHLIYSKNNYDQVHFKLEKHSYFFINFQNQSVSFYIENHTFDLESVKKLILDSISILGIKDNQATVKIITDQESKEKCIELIKNNYNFTHRKIACKTGPYEVLFYPDQKEFKLSKDQNFSAPSISSPEKIKVLVVDDSPVIRKMIEKLLSADKNIIIVAQTGNPLETEELIKKHQPDLMTLDIHMPEMNGVELLKSLPAHLKIPTIVISSISIAEGPLVLEALENGAFDYIQKPKKEHLKMLGDQLIEKINSAVSSSHIELKSVTPVVDMKNSTIGETDNQLIAIGSSTGGTNALRDILTKLPSQIPPILITQHIPAVFSKAFADRLNTLCSFRVKEAEDGEVIKSNHVYIAPGGLQMGIKQTEQSSYIVITDDAPVNNFKPSVDYLFDSIAKQNKHYHLMGIVITGMGNDGAKGLLNLKNKGARTFAQDEETSVVFGMPKEAYRIGATKELVALDQFPKVIVDALNRNHVKKVG